MGSHSLLRYWRQCLADGELLAPKRKREKEEIGAIPFVDLQSGQVDVEVATRIIDFVEERLNAKRSGRKRVGPGSGDDRPEIDSIDVAITPFRLRRAVEHGQSRHGDSQPSAPFWIAARLDREGVLSPPDGRAAWFVREHLDPAGRHDTVVGHLDDMDSFLSGSPSPEREDGTPATWQDLMTWAKAFFEAVVGTPLKGFRLEDHATDDGILLMPHAPQAGASRHLMGLYDALLRGTDGEDDAAPTPQLLKALDGENGPTEIDSTPTPHEGLWLRHLGHITESFGLGPSQRESLGALLRLGDGELMALNGPPGTGKTAWIQSAVASLWVERALAEGEPPIVVATSANNRAVTNILDIFQKASPPSGSGLAARWLPRIDTFGLFLPSQDQSQSTNHRWASSGRGRWSGLPELMEDRAYFEEGETYFLAQAGLFFGLEVSTIQAALEQLRAEMEATRDRMAAIQAAGKDLLELRGSMSYPSPKTGRECLSGERRVAEALVSRVEELAGDIDEAVTVVPFWEELLAFLPPIRDRRNHRFRRLFEHHGFQVPDLSGWSYRRPLAAAVEGHRRAVEAWSKAEGAWENGMVSLAEDVPASGEALAEAAVLDPRAVEPLLDLTLRRRLFLLAGRYWEGRWLLELRSLLGDTDVKKLHRQSRADCLARFRRFAKVTPLFVSTVYMLPKFFDCFDRGAHPLVNGIDLLIVEEAGQVAPELGGALLALAKRAVVLGDVFQIEPVWNLGRAVDDANRARYLPDSFDEEVFFSSRGSLMGIAQARTRFTAAGRSDGLWLREHRRCVPDVIAYCQRLVTAYREVLEPHRREISERQLPALGWAHVRSEARRSSGSWSNPGQAEAIARWLAGRRGALESRYRKPIGELVGIVTPFRAQVASLRRALEVAGIDADIEVGTVHTFQGGELPVMLFSPVVTREQPRPFFFDRNVNMLNVAVSRAQDSFLVLGDMRVFDPVASTPFSLLASFLFADESNQLPDVDPEPQSMEIPATQRISGLEAHRRVLREAFEEARDSLLIISPYLTQNAVDADQVLRQIRSARARVVVVYSTDMAKPEAGAVADLLSAAGAEVIPVRGFHTKTIAVDCSWFTHGSFNWLSAVRQEGATYQYLEASVRCGPPTAAEEIEVIWTEVEAAQT
ncbi:MAG: AAA domain-containing protein [Acidobacteriota bacterium]